MTTFKFTAFGIPQPQGSSKAFMPKGARFPIVTSDNPKLKGWRQVVAEAASRALQNTGQFFEEGGIALEARFYLQRPKSLGKKQRPHTTRPDADKLTRAILDALTGVVYRDDSQVVSLHLTKAYAEIGASPRAEVFIAQATLEPQALPLIPDIETPSVPLTRRRRAPQAQTRPDVGF